MTEQLNNLTYIKPPQIPVGEIRISVNVQIKAPVLSPIGQDEVNSRPVSNGIPAVTVKTSVSLDPEEQALLLQNVSRKLISHAKENKGAFNEEFAIIKKLADGIPYTNLSENEKAVIGRLGLNSNNVDKVFVADLSVLLKPYLNANQSQGFKNIMDAGNKVVEVIKVEYKKVEELVKKAKDLEKMQSLTKLLGAGKVSQIIEQQSDAFYKKIPAKLTPDTKMVLSDPMDIVTRGLVINSVKSPDNFNLVKDALTKIKEGKVITSKENSALQKLGFSVTKNENKTDSSVGSKLKLTGQEINTEKLDNLTQITDILFNPSPELQQILTASSEVLEQTKIVKTVGGKVEKSNQQVNNSEQQLKKYNSELNHSRQNFDRLIQIANVVNFLPGKKALNFNERLILQNEGITVVFQNNQPYFIKDSKSFSYKEITKKITDEISITEHNIQFTMNKIVALQTQLSQDIIGLDRDQQKLEEEEELLLSQKSKYEEVKKANTRFLNDKERNYVDNTLDPFIQIEYNNTIIYAENLIQEAERTKQRALETLKESDSILNGKDKKDNSVNNPVKEQSITGNIKEETTHPLVIMTKPIKDVEDVAKDNQRKEDHDKYLYWMISQDLHERMRSVEKRRHYDYLNRKEMQEWEKMRWDRINLQERDLKLEKAKDEQNYLYKKEKLEEKLAIELEEKRKEIRLQKA